MNGKMAFNEKEARRLAGAPVCAVLKDGTYYFGTIQAVTGDGVILNGFQGNGTLPSDSQKAQAQIKALGGLGSMLLGGGLGGGAGQNAGSGAQGGGQGGGLFGGGGASGFGGWGKGLKIGFNVLSFLMPLMGRFFI